MYRGRRLRATPVSRALIRETSLSVSDLVLPLFVVEGEGICREIPSLPGVFHYSVDRLEGIVEQMRACGVSACLLFGIPDHKDACGSPAYEENGVVQRAMRRLADVGTERAFFQSWVRREALTKRSGTGVGTMLSAEEPLQPGEQFYLLDTFPGYVAGVATRGGGPPGSVRRYALDGVEGFLRD